MTTIVRHRRTGNQYILMDMIGEIGKANPSRFISELFDRAKPEASSAAVCDARGNIFLAYIDDLVVVEIDGKKPAELLPEVSPEPAGDSVSEQADFEDEEFEDEEFDEELDEELDRDEDVSSSQPATSFGYGQNPNAQSQDDEEEDWI